MDIELKIEKILIIGLGLIGASFAKALRTIDDFEIYGIDRDEDNLKYCLQNNIIDFTADEMDISDIDLVIVSVPVDKIPVIVDDVLYKIKNTGIVIDTGSTKSNICKILKNHPNRKNFIASHPIAGTEYSGPTAAIENLFVGKKNSL
ncbi:MAG: prephenate dehydrogenase/arogenate dehydrogenase family protein [Saprospiraceae bacterium]